MSRVTKKDEDIRRSDIAGKKYVLGKFFKNAN